MLRSDEAPITGRLKISSPLGSEISILDGGFSIIGSGVTNWSGDLADGVYTIVLSAAERSQRWVVRVRGGQKISFPDDVPGASDWVKQDRKLEELAYDATIDYNGSNGVFVAVVAPDPKVRADLTRNLRLRRVDDFKMRRDTESPSKTKPSNWASVSYDVNPGAYLLTYETFERRIMDQLIYVVPGRRTVILLHYGQTGIIERQKEDSKLRKRRGIDPSRTIVVSIDRDSSPSRLLEDLRIAEILLHHLRTRARSVDPSVAIALLGPNIDPYLKLYAALGTLAMPGSVIQRLTASIHQDPNEDSEGAAAAKGLLEELVPYRDWPDVMCLNWRLRMPFDAQYSTLISPPMLEICWRWASAHSTRFQGIETIETSVLQTAEMAEPDASPWFAVSAAPAAINVSKASPKETKLANQGNVEHALVALTEHVHLALRRHQPVDSTDTRKTKAGLIQSSSIDFSQLSVTSSRVIQALINSGISDATLAPTTILPQLAASLASPISALETSIQLALAELLSLIERNSSDNLDIWNSDPNKGKFGSKSRMQGASISLVSFAETKDNEFLALQLEVRTTPRAIPITGPVTFYLHPTFSPSQQKVAPLNGVATFTCYALGSFTVGAETSDGRRLELDLSEIEALPMWFRTR
jgi:hypothetical protein